MRGFTSYFADRFLEARGQVVRDALRGNDAKRGFLALPHFLPQQNLLDTFSRACRGSADTDTDEGKISSSGMFPLYDSGLYVAESGYSFGESMSLYQDIDAKLGQVRHSRRVISRYVLSH